MPCCPVTRSICSLRRITMGACLLTQWSTSAVTGQSHAAVPPARAVLVPTIRRRHDSPSNVGGTGQKLSRTDADMTCYYCLRRGSSESEQTPTGRVSMPIVLSLTGFMSPSARPATFWQCAVHDLLGGRLDNRVFFATTSPEIQRVSSSHLTGN